MDTLGRSSMHVSDSILETKLIVDINEACDDDGKLSALPSIMVIPSELVEVDILLSIICCHWHV